MMALLLEVLLKMRAANGESDLPPLKARTPPHLPVFAPAYSRAHVVDVLAERRMKEWSAQSMAEIDCTGAVTPAANRDLQEPVKFATMV
jgi:hypothetical protein